MRPPGSRRSSWENKRQSWGKAQRELAAAATHLEIARNLRDIYLFARRHLNEARLERQGDKVDRVATLLGELRDGFAQASNT